MRRIFACSLIASLTAFAPAAQAQDDEAPTVSAIRAQLYYEETGTFSRDVLSGEPFALWNVIIGEGAAAHASNHTLVTVEVTGRNVPFDAAAVEILVRDSSDRLIAAQTSEVSIYDEAETFIAPVLLFDTGCEPLTVSARIIGDVPDSSETSAVIPFECGE